MKKLIDQADSWLQLPKVPYVGERKLRTPAAHRIPFQIWVSSVVSESDDGGSQITSNRQIRRRALTLHVKELCSVCQSEVEASDDTGTVSSARCLFDCCSCRCRWPDRSSAATTSA